MTGSGNAARPGARTTVLTALAMIAFAANSLLCREALVDGSIDPGAFALIRVVSGAVALALFVTLGSGRPDWRPEWASALMLAAYLVFFTFAYVSLTAGTGALILFGAVQLTMFTRALLGGERFSGSAIVGLAIAVTGLVILVAPGVTAPRPGPAAGMAIAGVAWGIYSLLGRQVADPLASTARNFAWATLLVLPVALLAGTGAPPSTSGVVLAVASGVFASALGYVIWYAALAGLSAGQAATVQLSVPVIAAIGGVLLLNEAITIRLVLASAATLGGVALALRRRSPGT